ncbi:MAG: S-adenosylmethionine:tRNA ribosyltransferase-isomerase [Chitinophagaceae bacterium]|nr:S-adenosylmethionine:tRNA ribosyltransferase-isomerase [Chitinophagaceae bacterium]
MPQDPREISILDYTYTLPDEQIARYPLAERDLSRLLVYEEGRISTAVYRDLSAFIPEESLLVFNDTKVVEARLLFQKPTGGWIEIFCLEPHEQYADVHSAMLQQGHVDWHCLVGGASKWKPGQLLEKNIQTARGHVKLTATFLEKRSGSFIIRLNWTPATLAFAELLHLAGAIPLPPYLKRKAEASDTNSYQTVYAKEEGSVAAPTAGLHFTEQVFTKLQAKNIRREFVTLHVGAGTFQPVKAEKMEAHAMHAEWIDVSRPFIETLLKSLSGTIITVGTTSLRTVESLYWIGVKIVRGEWSMGSGGISQWEVYEGADKDITTEASLTAVLDWMKANHLERLVTKTQILIAPGYRFRIIKGLITNFHQPQSTLLLLVAAITGEDWRKIYTYALQEGFRFLSYGDGSLLWLKK